MDGRVHHATLAGDADCSQGVVTGDHATREVSSPQSLDGRSRPGLQLILEDDKAQEPQARLCLLPGKELRLVRVEESNRLTASFFEPSAMTSPRYSYQP